MRFFRLVFAALLSASIAVAAEDFTHEFRAMGTFFRLTFYETGARAGGEAARAAEAEVRAIERACNRFDPASELARLNAAAFRRPVTCSERLWELFSAADRHVRGSGGAFDPTVAPLMKLWGFHRKRRALPGAEEIAPQPAARPQFNVGDQVEIVDGPFTGFKGTVLEIDMERGFLRVEILVFSRATPMELEFWQVEKFVE